MKQATKAERELNDFKRFEKKMEEANKNKKEEEAKK